MEQQRKGPADEPDSAASSPPPGVKPEPPDGSTAPPPDSKYWPWLFGFLLIAGTLLAYLPAWRGGFIWDDDTHISENEVLRLARGLSDIWFQPGATCQYYPLSFTVFWADYHLWGLNPLGYHLQNLLLHGLVAVMLWQVLKRLEVRAAWLAGAIFALHPVNVMSVAWMTELKNTLSGALVLGAAWAYLRFAGLGVYETRTPAGKGWRYGLLALALFQLSMFAKTAVSFLPLTLLLLAWWKRGRFAWRWMWPLPVMLGIAAGMGLLTLHVEHIHGAAGDDFRMGLLERVLVSGRSFWFYLGKLFFPYPLTFIYERWQIDAGAWWQYAYPAAMAGLLGGLWWWRGRAGKGPWAAMMHFYVATSLLVLIQVLYMMRFTFVSDHWQYFGCMSVMALAAAGMDTALDFVMRGRRFVKWTVYGVLLSVLGVLTWRQCGMYRDVETLWRTTLDRNPDCWMAHSNLGDCFYKRGHIEEAMGHYRKAIQINPNYYEALSNVGLVLAGQGRWDEAIDNYRRALRVNPDFYKALNNLGLVLAAQGRWDEAIEHYQRAIRINPNSHEVLNNLGAALATQGRLDEAIEYYRRAIQVKPDYDNALNNLGLALAAQGRFEEAIEHYRKAIQVNPNFNSALNNLGFTLTARGRPEEAIECFHKSIQADPNHAETFVGLGIALAQSGRTREAAAQYREALKLNPDLAAVLNNLAWILAASPEAGLRDGAEAVQLAGRACELTQGQEPLFVGTLAAAYAEAGRFPEAAATAEKAAQLADRAGLSDLAAKNRQLLELYRAGKPYHEPLPLPAPSQNQTP
jgi:protein O-mannosyl-transferase